MLLNFLQKYTKLSFIIIIIYFKFRYYAKLDAIKLLDVFDT